LLRSNKRAFVAVSRGPITSYRTANSTPHISYARGDGSRWPEYRPITLWSARREMYVATAANRHFHGRLQLADPAHAASNAGVIPLGVILHRQCGRPRPLDHVTRMEKQRDFIHRAPPFLYFIIHRVAVRTPDYVSVSSFASTTSAKSDLPGVGRGGVNILPLIATRITTLILVQTNGAVLCPAVIHDSTRNSVTD